MPFLPVLATLAAVVGTGITAGESLFNRPGSPKPTAGSTAQTPAQQTAIQNQQKAVIGQQLPNILGATSGLANPDYVAQMAQLLSGTAGQSGSTGAANKAVASAFGFGNDFSFNNPTTFTPVGAGGNPSTAAGAFPTSPVSLSDFTNSFLR